MKHHFDIETIKNQNIMINEQVSKLESAGINTTENRMVLYSNPEYADKLTAGLLHLNTNKILTLENRFRLCSHSKRADKIAWAIGMLHQFDLDTIENWLMMSQLPERAMDIAYCFTDLHRSQQILDTEIKQKICSALSHLTQEEAENFTEALGILHFEKTLTNTAVHKLCVEPKSAKQFVESHRADAFFKKLQDKSVNVESKIQLVHDFVKKGGDINQAFKDKKTLLHWAVCTNELSLVKAVIDLGALVDLEDADQATPLNCAVRFRHENTSKIINLLCNSKANVNHEDSLGAPLHVAVCRESFSGDKVDEQLVSIEQARRLEIARTLIEHSAVVSLTVRGFGITPLALIGHDSFRFDDTDLGLISLLFEKKVTLFEKDNGTSNVDSAGYLLTKLGNNPKYIPAFIKLVKQTCLDRMTDIKRLIKLCEEIPHKDDIFLPIKKELTEFIKEHEVPPNLNGAQRGIIDAVLVFIVEAIAELKPEDVIRCYDAMVIDSVSISEQQKFENLGIWECIKQVRDILQHPCPENRNVSYTLNTDASDLQEGYSVYKEFLEGSGVKRGNSKELLFPNGRVIAAVDVVNYSESGGYFKAREKLGLLGLTSREDKKTPPVTKKAVVDYIKSIIKQERLKFEIAKPKDDSIKLQPNNPNRFYSSTQNDQVDQLLKYIVDGNQDMAKQMIKKNPELVLMKGRVTDFGNREFKEIYPLHYPIWANDGRMANMIFDCLDEPEFFHNELLTQFCEVNKTGVSYVLNGKSFTSNQYDIQAYFGELELYIYLDSNGFAEGQAASWKQITELQRTIPMHILQYYCARNVDFSKQGRMNRDEFERAPSLPIYMGENVFMMHGKPYSDSIFSKLDSNCGVGRDYALVRGYNIQNVYGLKDGLPERLYVQCDLNTLEALWFIDQEEITQLHQKLNDSIWKILTENGL